MQNTRDTVGGVAVALPEETCCWEMDLRMCGFVPFPVCSLSFGFEVEDVISQLPALVVLPNLPHH